MSDLSAKFERLSEQQRESVRLVSEHYTRSKDQAQLLGLSPHAIDARIKKALRTLGASSREEAGRMYLEYQRQVHQSPDLPTPVPAPPTSSVSTDEDDAGQLQPDAGGRPDPGPAAVDLGEPGGGHVGAGGEPAIQGDGAPPCGGHPPGVAVPAGRAYPARAGDDLLRARRPLLPEGGWSRDIAPKLAAICGIALLFTLASGAGLAGLVALQTLLDRSGPMALPKPPASVLKAR
jgi:DNA-binding CsgD family transcriptional regulator